MLATRPPCESSFTRFADVFILDLLALGPLSSWIRRIHIATTPIMEKVYIRFLVEAIAEDDQSACLNRETSTGSGPKSRTGKILKMKHMPTILDSPRRETVGQGFSILANLSLLLAMCLRLE